MTQQIPYRRYPCAECPWRRDTAPGQFTAERYEAMACTSEQAPGEQPGLGAPLFACHKSPEGAEEACAGWLAAVGHNHIRVRLAIAQGRLPAEAMTPGEGWPDLYPSYRDMAARQARRDDR